MPRLSSRLIATLAPPAKEYTVWDDAIPGFGLRCWPSGRMVYICKYRLRGQRQTHRYTLGTTAVLDPPQARAMAQEVLAAVRSGRDPATEARQASTTVADLAERYLRDHARPKKRPRSVIEDQRNLTNHVLPALGTRLVAQITRQDIATLHATMQDTPTAANRVLALLSTMFGLAEAWGLRDQRTNPAYGIQRYRERTIERFLSGEELLRLGQALADAEYQQTALPAAIACIRLLLFTGARLGEILGLRWNMIDMARGTARLPDSKSGAKTIRLPAPALDVLRALPRTAPHVLVGKQGKPLAAPHDMWRRTCASAGIVDCRIHALRHTFASIGVMGGLSLPIVGRLLGHSSPQITQRYGHFADDPLALASEQIAARVRQAMGGQ